MLGGPGKLQNVALSRDKSFSFPSLRSKKILTLFKKISCKTEVIDAIFKTIPDNVVPVNPCKHSKATST